MTALFAAIRTIAFATLFVWLWTMVGLWARQFDPIFGGALPSWTWPLGVVVLMAGVPLALTCMALFAIRGKGTPAPFDPPRTFVAFGPYRAVRNPMYVGGWLTIVGFALIARSSSVLVFSFAWLLLIHLFVIRYEEPALTAKFGATYDRYRSTVPRWIPMGNW
jgi:protein-S-isoprenylcysteine O-methyltransferase Ste14